MHLTANQLTAAKLAALSALNSAGVPQTHVVLAFTNTPRDDEDGTFYETHVGATRDVDVASMLHLAAKDATSEADRAAQALFGDRTCPSCSSPRYALKREFDEDDSGPRYRVRLLDECLDCGHTSPREPRL